MHFYPALEEKNINGGPGKNLPRSSTRYAATSVIRPMMPTQLIGALQSVRCLFDVNPFICEKEQAEKYPSASSGRLHSPRSPNYHGREKNAAR